MNTSANFVRAYLAVHQETVSSILTVSYGLKFKNSTLKMLDLKRIKWYKSNFTRWKQTRYLSCKWDFFLGVLLPNSGRFLKSRFFFKSFERGNLRNFRDEYSNVRSQHFLLLSNICFKGAEITCKIIYICSFFFYMYSTFYLKIIDQHTLAPSRSLACTAQITVCPFRTLSLPHCCDTLWWLSYTDSKN